MKGLLVLALLAASGNGVAQTPWRFAVSGDSRNCGNVVMPAIAKAVKAEGDRFYWHLGDFRALYDFDEDLVAEDRYQAKHPTITEYQSAAWPDFIEHQLVPFEGVPVYLGIGNHELVSPKTRGDYVAQFADWLDKPELQAQRLKDNKNDHVLKTYYHFVKDGVDFLTLDNAEDNSFDKAQLAWVKGVLQADEGNPAVKTIVAGMHEALPASRAAGHSMSESGNGVKAGTDLYQALLHARDAGKKVYVLASHSHFYMADIFNTPELRAKNAVLPGWIVGTAGAHRYVLPQGVVRGPDARSSVYGYMTGTVAADGTVDFAFREFSEEDLQNAGSGYKRELVRFCYAENHD